MFEDGKLFKQDDKKAFDLYEESAKAYPPSPQGMVNLGRAFFYGIGTDEDNEMGFSWWKKAAMVENPLLDAQKYYEDALMHKYGKNMSKEKETLEFYRHVRDTNVNTMYKLGMIYLYEPGQEREEEGIELLRKAAEQGNEVARKFMAAYNEAIKLCGELTLLDSNKPKNAVIAALHKSIQSETKLTEEERRHHVLEYITNGTANSQNLTTKQLSSYLLVLAHVLLLYKEAPDNEQNICMIVDLLESGISDEIDSDTDLLYDYFRNQKGIDHSAIRIYGLYHDLTGSYTSQVAENCRELFPVIGSVNDIFGNAFSCADAAVLADILAYSFNAISVDDFENLIEFRVELATNYIRRNGNTSGVTYEQLLDFVSRPFSKSALGGFHEFFYKSKPNSGEHIEETETTVLPDDEE